VKEKSFYFSTKKIELFVYAFYTACVSRSRVFVTSLETSKYNYFAIKWYRRNRL